MLTRDSVKKRMDSDQGISFLEFSYQLFQVRSSRVLPNYTEILTHIAYVFLFVRRTTFCICTAQRTAWRRSEAATSGATSPQAANSCARPWARCVCLIC